MSNTTNTIETVELSREGRGSFPYVAVPFGKRSPLHGSDFRIHVPELTPENWDQFVAFEGGIEKVIELINDVKRSEGIAAFNYACTWPDEGDVPLAIDPNKELEILSKGTARGSQYTKADIIGFIEDLNAELQAITSKPNFFLDPSNIARLQTINSDELPRWKQELENRKREPRKKKETASETVAA